MLISILSLCSFCKLPVGFQYYEAHHDKAVSRVSDQVRQNPVCCTTTEGIKEPSPVLDLGIRGIVLSM